MQIFETTIQIANSSQQPKMLWLEPWGEKIEMCAKSNYLITATANEQGIFEIEQIQDEIIVCAWAGSTARVFCNGREIGGERPFVPNVPEGQSVSSFIKFMFGK